jgi:hypothetical protein
MVRIRRSANRNNRCRLFEIFQRAPDDPFVDPRRIHFEQLVSREQTMDMYCSNEQPALPEARAKTRDELDILLSRLDEDTSQLIAQHPDEVHFMPLFADRADAIARQADAMDHAWVLDRIDAVLEKHGRHVGGYLPPHDLAMA